MKEAIFRLTTPLITETINFLKIGDRVLLSGTIYTARDYAHKRIIETLTRGEELPFPLSGAVIYYAGPSPAPPWRIIGAAGPTTSYRMDIYSPILIAQGLKAMIGKGKRNEEVKQAIKKYMAIYLVAIGGAGALIARCIKEAQVIAYPELGPEAIQRLIVKDMPLFVANDIHGGDIYQQNR